MENFKKASKEKLRFQTARGPLSVEQLWDLSPKELDTLAISLEAEHEASGRKSFLVKRSVKDTTVKLKFDIVLEILSTKLEEAETAREAAENREFNATLDTLIAEKKADGLKKKSVKELEGMRRGIKA